MSVDDLVTVLPGDCRDLLKTLPAESVHCVVTSPPYFGLRDYNVEGQIGLEQTPDAYVEQLVAVFREVRRVLHPDGTVWLNLGDSYAGSGKGRNADGSHQEGGKQGTSLGTIRGLLHKTVASDALKPKDLIGIPWLVAFALQADGWYLRSDVIWSKKACMPESVTDRPTRSHEYVFLLTKQANYYYDADAIREKAAPSSLARIAQPNFANQTGGPKDYANGTNANRSMRKTLENFALNPGRNCRDVWTLGPEPCQEAHFAVMPTKLVEPCILAGTSEKGCCPACLAPWKRVVERERAPRGDAFGVKTNMGDFDHGQAGSPYMEVVAQKTVGWEPTCACNAGDPIPCTVLDPFAGSGTVLRVAAQHRRHGIGIELNPEYVALMQRRLTVQQGLFFENEVAV